jgi:hypothetical protein
VSPSPTETVERDLIGAWLSSRLRSVRSPVAPKRRLEAMQMIVIGADVHKQSATVVAADEVGRIVRRANGRNRE